VLQVVDLDAGVDAQRQRHALDRPSLRVIVIVTSCSGFTLPPSMPSMSKVSVPSMLQ
jgi:hypothetical protein